MMISDVSRTNCLIVGAGALGLLIAAAIKKSQQSDGKNGYVGVFNRRLLPVPVTVQLPDGENVDMTSCLNTEIPDWFAHSSARRIVFFCLPPESTEVVSLSFLNNAKAIFEASQNVTIVFCNNGCLPRSLISHLESEGFATLRALFFIGAVRQESSMGTCVSWTGGNRAVWNEIVSANPSPVVESQEVLQQLSFLLNSGERFVDWLRTDNIFAMERCKFFTNFILAAGIGRRKEKNKRLYSRLNSGTLDMTASQCARLWQ
ncbi:MAG: hypothetical protein RJB13_2309, partial [Pseudomonadota bacterium]